MTQTSALPRAAGVTDDQFAGTDGTKLYAPRPGQQLRNGFVLFCVGLFGIFPLKSVLDWLSGGPVPDAKVFLALIFLLILPAVGFVLLIANAIRGLPLLTITSRGVTVKSGLGTTWADWNSLGPFAIRSVHAGRSGRSIQMASARVVGANTNKSRRAKTFSVPDHFKAPIGTIVDELNAARSRAVGAAETPPDIEPGAASFGLASYTLPWLTFALLAVLIVLFMLENEFAITPGVRSTPSLATLFALGALNSKAVISAGQWYRLFTAPLLHANVAHLVGNGVALVMSGWFLERLVGRLWFFALFVIGALGGSLMSLAVEPANQISVGASGAIMALFAAMLVSSFRLASGTGERTRMQVLSARVLIPSLLPLFSTSGVHIDYGAHFGGALSGAIVVAGLLRFWPEAGRIPQLRTVAAATSIVGAVLFAASAGMVIVNYPAYRDAAARPLPAIIPRQNPFPPVQPNTAPQARSSLPEPQSDAVLDHGPGRVACDQQWSQSADKSADRYPDFLRNCMKK